jgi:DNA-directed RNA polymerase subunit RPC12/RpoP
MTKVVTCKRCNEPFWVEGPAGALKEEAVPVACPYCKEPNEIPWAPDSIIRAVPI